MLDALSWLTWRKFSHPTFLKLPIYALVRASWVASIKSLTITASIAASVSISAYSSAYTNIYKGTWTPLSYYYSNRCTYSSATLV